ncbi:MAG TPA: hypothetical protein DD725_08240 [Deltaproteobacteria bacterium]|nr:hypothetical protein [Deltaproteobacteria bacterium]
MSLYRRKDSRIWWMSFKVNGRRVRMSTGVENKKLAEKINAKSIVDIQEDKWFENQGKKRTLQEMIERFRTEYTDQKTYHSKVRDTSVFKSLYSFFGENCTLANIENLIGGYEQHRKSAGIKPATILKELGLLRRMFNVSRKQWKWKVPNPVSDIELPKVNNGRIRYLSPDEREKLFAVLDEMQAKWIKPFVVIALETGLRLSNLCNLMWSEVNMFSKIITINAEKMKNDDHIGIPLTGMAYETLKELQKIRSLSDCVFHDNGQKLYPFKVQRLFKKALTASEIEDFHFHDLRHTFASMLVQNGADLYGVQKLLGHKDSRMTQRYAHMSMDALRGTISKLDVTFKTHAGGYEKAVSI